MEAEATAAALEAERVFDATRGVSWEAFLRLRIIHAALARYRAEWTYAIRWASAAVGDESGMAESVGLPSHEAIYTLLQDALRRLSPADARLIESLFWEGKTEVGLGKALGISQQAVSKRKKAIFKILRRTIDLLADGEDYWL